MCTRMVQLKRAIQFLFLDPDEHTKKALENVPLLVDRDWTIANDLVRTHSVVEAYVNFPYSLCEVKSNNHYSFVEVTGSVLCDSGAMVSPIQSFVGLLAD